MPIAVMTLKLSLADAHSLKDKRRLIKSLKDRLRQNFNVSVAEMDLQDVWQSAVLGVCAISPDKRFAEAVISKVADFVRADHRIFLAAYDLEVF
jgi:uncharacterized protein YlxP (DUF503 family)